LLILDVLRPLSAKDLPENAESGEFLDENGSVNSFPHSPIDTTTSPHYQPSSSANLQQGGSADPLDDETAVEMSTVGYDKNLPVFGIPDDSSDYFDDDESESVTSVKAANNVMSEKTHSAMPDTPPVPSSLFPPSIPTPGSAESFAKWKKLSDVDKEKAIGQLRAAFSEFYRGLSLLQSFARLNVEAIEKILKKHDKNIELGARERYMSEIIVNFSFFRRRALKALMRETEARSNTLNYIPIISFYFQFSMCLRCVLRLAIAQQP